MPQIAAPLFWWPKRELTTPMSFLLNWIAMVLINLGRTVVEHWAYNRENEDSNPTFGRKKKVFELIEKLAAVYLLEVCALF